MLLQLFPGRFLEEIDAIDVSRVERALEARAIARQVASFDGYLSGRTSPEQFKDKEGVGKEVMAWRRNVNN